MPTVISGTTLNALTTVSWGVMSLFANNEQGVWFDPSDLNNYMSGLGPELVTNGDFSSGTGWTIGSGWSISGGTLNYSGAYNTSYFTAASNAFVAGRYYKVTLTISGNTSGNVNVFLNVPNNAVLNPVNISGNGEKTFFLLAGATCNGLHFVGNSATGAMSIDNISVKELTTISSATMYQDAAGTTPVTAVEQPVGLLLDKSKGLVLGSELVTNGDFSSNTWWSIGFAAISGGALNFTAAVATSGAYRLGFATVGKYYELTFEIISISSGGVQISLGTSVGTNRTAAGVYTQRILCTGNGNLTLYSVGASTTASVDNVSIKEVQGNHASQATSASRPVLSARVNLLTYTEQFDNAAWSKVAISVSANTTVSPNGTQTADTITCQSGSNNHYFPQTLSSSLIATTHTYTLRVKYENHQWFLLQLYDGTNSAYACFDLLNKVVGSKTVGVTSSIVQVAGTDFYTLTLTSSVLAGSGYVYGHFVTSDRITVQVWTATGTEAITVWGADLRVTNVGVGIPAYQRVGAAVTGTTNPAVTGVPDYDTAGFPLYLKFDGVDDSLSTSSIDFSATDKMTVFHGHRIIGTAYGVLVNGPVSTFATFQSVVHDSSKYQGNITTNASSGYWIAETAAIYSSPRTDISSILLDTAQVGATNAVKYRLNGTLLSMTGVIGGSPSNVNFGNMPLTIGMYAGNSNRFNGHLYSLIVRGALSNSVDITNTEAYINSKTKAY